MEFAREQVQTHGSSDDLMQSFAAIPLQDAERGCLRLFQKHDYVAPVKVEHVCIGSGSLSKFPYVKLSSVAQWLLDTNRLWRVFCGTKSWEKMQEVLAEFWRRYRELHPQHEVFELWT